MMVVMSIGRLLTGFHFTTAYVVVAILLFSQFGKWRGYARPDQADPPGDTLVQNCPIPGTALEVSMVKVPARTGTSRSGCPSMRSAGIITTSSSMNSTSPSMRMWMPSQDPLVAIHLRRSWLGSCRLPRVERVPQGALAFCQWLSASTGTTWRLPTIDEWRIACELGDIDPEKASEHAWLKSNGKRRTHKLATRSDALGLHDLHGNVAEWCRMEKGKDEFVLAGTCYLDDRIDCDMFREPVPQWNDTDPQIPKSIWWLADAPFAGFRIVCDQLSEKTSPPPKDASERNHDHIRSDTSI